jgi:cell migration-inducing and hyaluronan-binding protein
MTGLTGAAATSLTHRASPSLNQDVSCARRKAAMLACGVPEAALVKAQRAALFSRRPPQAPITLIHNGKEFKAPGDQTTVRAGTEIEVKTERPQVTLSLAEMDKGSWVMFELPGFTKAASGTPQASMAALRQANETSWFRDGDALWVKLVAAAPVRPVIRPTDLQASIAVSR